MVTKEQLLTNSSMARMLARQGKSVKGVLTAEEQQGRLDDGAKTIMEMTSVLLKGNVFFYTDDYCMGVNIPEFKEKHLVSGSSVMPHSVHPRKGCEDGIVYTVKQYEAIFHKDHRRLNSIEELVDFLNSEVEKD